MSFNFDFEDDKLFTGKIEVTEDGNDDFSIDDNFKKDNEVTFEKDRDKNVDTKSNKKRTKKINLFKEEAEPVPLDPSKMKSNNSIVFMLPDGSVEIDDKTKNNLKELFKLLGNKKYNVRVLCNNVTPLIKDIIDSVGFNNLTVVKPWKKYCNAEKFKIWLPSNDNISAAAEYIKNFNKLPTGIKYINSSYITLLFGMYNNYPVKFAVIYDPNYDGKKIAFEKSKEDATLIVLVKKIKDYTIPLINLADINDFKDFVKLLEAQ